MKIKKLTEKQKKTYLKNPNVCPSCESEEVESTDKWEDMLCIYEEWHCKDCDKWWIETYTLTNVELV